MIQKRSHARLAREAKLTPEVLNEHFHSNLHFERNWTDALAEFLTQQFGTIVFLAFNVGFFILWFLFNLDVFGIPPFDPFPFNLLTMIVSLEAIFLSVVVLISQNRQGRIADIRQQMDFEIDVRSEEEITKMLYILDDLRQKAGIEKHDDELEQMKLRVDLQRIQAEAEQQN